MLKYFYRFLIDLTNNLYISSIVRAYTTSKISKRLIPSFIKVFKINEGEIEKNINDYKSLHDFFIRTLKKDARQIDEDSTTVISPVDGFVEDLGTITEEKNILVKGQLFSIRKMLGNDQAFEKYIDGVFMIIYLSPKDYHRIHSPVSGQVISQWDLGGKSYPVNKWGLKYGKSPLSENYRKISEIECNGVHVVLAKVGALFINSVTLTHENEFLEKGEEIGYFSFGSTVILLFEKDSFKANGNIKNKSIKMGQKIGVLVQNLLNNMIE
ncbi:phosphatidylserine decarboxylase [Schinkia azotoformans]|uniref:phosphatidylserine decarboxylase n=1 Tax=Schinkia azotoformans TaxID=1454 RepID=UPI002DB937F2|nr:phosphatidylserine decarboxylase [Schinkia azotoformans]MEC1696662.1 phosphatidylserine decarboxylase [Schinkia azotoformans]MEC1715632.1 phosphatidylserine decarboxylase [Schinkia azotoformans]MEC1726136.1 phosphatidylserine decarboxylase [Schinkia azotoformans]MEC1742174.1 phosphatidylserine decarboxylase [Schinkia azotoformans]MEC1744878.1 phosphatidylserine decarboxylase [Schinkia azotoformans]